jgi:transcription elongation factor/antiterminator RfaH
MADQENRTMPGEGGGARLSSMPMVSLRRETEAQGENHARWYVVCTQPSAENRAIFHLEMQGYRIFCPRYRKFIRHARKKTQILAPLFSGYLFVTLDGTHGRWRSINGTRGVARLLMQGDAPQPVPPGVVETLIAHMDSEGAMDWMPSLATGQAVRIADGPFADFIGTLERLDASGRVHVLLDFLGRSVSVILHRRALTPAA